MFFGAKIPNLGYFSNLTSLLRHNDVFDVIFVILTSFIEKMKHMLYQQSIPLFNVLLVRKKRILGYFSNLTSLLHHNDVFYVIFVILTSFIEKIKHMVYQQSIPLFNVFLVRETEFWVIFQICHHYYVIMTGLTSFLTF